MNTATKLTFAVAVSIFGLSSQLQTVYAKQPQSHAAMTGQHNQAAKTPVQHNQAAKTLVLRVGSKGPAVKQLQEALQKQGYYKGPINGIFNPQVRSAVIAFQKSEHLTPDGVVGPKTQAAMKQHKS
jgi:peptidoglycan hydrolase-like protein with peptidoglycan-binding domain